MAGIVGWLRRWLGSAGGLEEDGVPTEAAWEFVERVMEENYFTQEAKSWLRESVRLQVDDVSLTSGGGYWSPTERKVRLFTAQHEAAVHELAHAWWHYRRDGASGEMIDATIRLSAEADPRYATMQRLAHGYVHGIPEQPWEGLLVARNDWEMVAGLASGCMGDMRMLPPYVRRLYSGLFRMPER